MEKPQHDKPTEISLLKIPVEKVKEMEVRHDDVFLITYPKSGTHWLMEAIPLIMNNGDAEISAKFEKRVLPIEFLIVGEGDDPRILHIKKNFAPPENFDFDKMESPRSLCTHVSFENLPTQLLEKKAKVVYLARNPKDVAVSMLNQMARPPMNIPNDMSLFLERVFYKGAAVETGDWASHVLDWWKLKDEDHVLYLKYEDLKKDLKSGIQTIANFLGKPLTPEIIEEIADHCSIEKMKKSGMEDPVVKGMGWKDNPFVRKGKVGGWKEKLTVAQSEEMDKYCEERLEGSGLEFNYE